MSSCCGVIRKKRQSNLPRNVRSNSAFFCRNNRFSLLCWKVLIDVVARSQHEHLVKSEAFNSVYFFFTAPLCSMFSGYWRSIFQHPLQLLFDRMSCHVQRPQTPTTNSSSSRVGPIKKKKSGRSVSVSSRVLLSPSLVSDGCQRAQCETEQIDH